MLPVTVCHILTTEYATYMLHRCAHSVLQQISSHLWREKQDSKELSPRSLDKMLLKLQVNSQNVQSTQLSKFFKISESELLQFI